MSKVFDHAYRLIVRREHSVGEFRRKLEKKWSKDDEIYVVIDRFLDEGLLCDRSFAAAFLRSRVNKLQGPRKIRAELLRRSVSDTHIEEALQEAEISWNELALNWLSRQSGVSDDYQTRAKFYRRLMNRGFTHGQAMDALKAR